MQKGKIENAERIALNQFDKWNEVSGVIQEHTGYYYELQALMKEAVHIGIQMALEGKVKFDEAGNILIPGP